MSVKNLHIAILLAFLLIGGVTAVDLEWSEVNSTAFPSRYWHGSCVFDGKVWVSGGYNGTNYLNDVWYSSDGGATWTCANSSAGFNARAGHAMEALGSKMYVIGGYNGTAGANSTYPAMWDVWESTNGVTWTLTTNTPAWKGTYSYYGSSYGMSYMGSMVGDSKIWLTGGYLHNTYTGARNLTRAVWYSTDGSTWTYAGNLPLYTLSGYGCYGWEKHRNEWMSVSHVGGKITTIMAPTGTYPTAGTAYSSYDGATWTTRTTSGYWTPRSEFGMTYLDSKLILFGGYGSDSLYKRDVWYSSDEGTTWTQYSDADWSIRMGLSAVEVNTTHIMITGGYGPTGALDDVWVGSLNSTATSTYEDDTSGWGIQYPPHSVRIVFMDTFGNPITDATVTATPVETSLGAWGWLSDVFGFDESVDIGGTALIGTTGSDGALSFMMIPEIRYSINVNKTSAGINETLSIFPKESEYFFRIGSLPHVENYPDYNLTISSVNATHVRLAMSYNDTAEQTTGMNFYVYNTTGGLVYSSPVTLTGGAGSAYYDVPDTRGTSFKFGFNGTNSDHGNVSAYQGVDMKGSGRLIEYGWPDIWYWVLSIAIVFLVAGAISETDVKIGAIIVPIFAGLFWYIGWLPASVGVVINVVFFIGAFYYIRASAKAVDA